MTARVAAWLAIEALPAFRALRRAPGARERLETARLRWLLERSRRTGFGERRLRDAGVGAHDLDGDPVAALRAIPPVSKRELRLAGSATLHGGRVDPAWCSTLSSGSTGEPFRVHYDPRAWAIVKYLTKLRARRACGVRPGDRVALLDAIPPDPRAGELGRLDRVRCISVLQPAERIVAMLAQFRPAVVYGLPSSLAEAARALAGVAQRLGIRRVFTSGELLHPVARRALRQAFRCPVLDVYGTTETKEIAWECPAGGLHINADVVRVEVLDATGLPAPSGEEGEIVVSLLVNAAMPLLRYRTGDRGSLLPGACRCGVPLPRLGVVTGREADYLDLDGGRRVSPYAITTALERVTPLTRYQVIQLGPRRVRVRAAVAAGADARSVEIGIRSALVAAVAGPLDVDVEFGDRFEVGERGKFRVVQPLEGGP